MICYNGVSIKYVNACFVIYSPSRHSRSASPKKISSLKPKAAPSGDGRFRFAAVVILCIAAIITFRLSVLMIVDHGSYKKLALGAQEVSSELIPKRGEIFLQDTRSGQKDRKSTRLNSSH